MLQLWLRQTQKQKESLPMGRLTKKRGFGGIVGCKVFIISRWKCGFVFLSVLFRKEAHMPRLASS
jgi:hypothetical protein